LLEPFTLPFAQRALFEVLLLAVPAGLIGTWIVLRGLAFFSHAVGTAAFPGLVLADGLGFAAPLGALGAAAVFAAFVVALGGRRSGREAAVALVLVGALAGGVILASDVFASGSNVETLLFGSLLLVDGGDLAFAAAAAVATLGAGAILGQRWLTGGFDPSLPSSGGPGPRTLDGLLVALVALATAAAITVVGSLLVAALFVVPAATARLLTKRMGTWQALSVALVAAEGVIGVWLAVMVNAPPGATIAVLSGSIFILVAAARALPRPARAAAATTLLAVALGGLGCGASEEKGQGRIEVVATTTQVGDLVRSVGGEVVDVDQLLSPNSDPHEYEPRPQDVVAVADSRLVFASGGGLDEWIEGVVDDAGSDAELVELAELVEPTDGSEAEGRGHDHGEHDPHWWHDPRNAIAAVGEIERALATAEPDRRSVLARNADSYVARLKALDAGIARCFEAVPASRRRIVTDHDAFGPFAERYGIEVVGTVIPAQTSEAQASARDLSELSEAIEAAGVTAVLPERSLSPGAAQAVARQTGATARYSLYGDSLGPDGSAEETYIGMEESNADAVMRAITDGRRGCRPEA